MKIGKIIYNTISALVLIMFVAMAILLVGIKLFGFTPYAVLSGSMEPLYPTGSVVYVQSVEAEDVKIDDVITFYMADGKTVVTHQVINIDKANGLYYTQGLANEAADGTPTKAENIIGRVAFGVPFLGFISTYVTSPPWIFIIIAVVLVWAIVVYMLDIAKKDKEEKLAEKRKSKPRKRRIEQPKNEEPIKRKRPTEQRERPRREQSQSDERIRKERPKKEEPRRAKRYKH